MMISENTSEIWISKGELIVTRFSGEILTNTVAIKCVRRQNYGLRIHDFFVSQLVCVYGAPTTCHILCKVSVSCGALTMGVIGGTRVNVRSQKLVCYGKLSLATKRTYSRLCGINVFCFHLFNFIFIGIIFRDV